MKPAQEEWENLSPQSKVENIVPLTCLLSNNYFLLVLLSRQSILIKRVMEMRLILFKFLTDKIPKYKCN